MTGPQQPRPDQQSFAVPAGVPGSRSGAGDIAGVLSYPGVPAAVPNMQQFRMRRQPAGQFTLGTFPEPARIWVAILSYFVASSASFTGGVTQVFAEVDTILAATTLGIVELGVAGAADGHSGQSNQGFGGMPVTAGESVVLNVNNSNTIAQLFQRASVVVLYSIP